MSDVTWPAWMPEPPPLHNCFTTGCEVCRNTLLAWYGAAKAADPDFGHVTPPPTRYQQVVRRDWDATDPTYEAAKRAAFPLPEDETDDGA